MTPHPRFLGAIKWPAAILAALFLALWIASIWFWLGWESPRGHWIAARQGELFIAYLPTGEQGPPGGSWRFERNPNPFLWLPIARFPGFVWELYLPLWLLSLTTAIVAFIAHLAEARALRRANLCRKCRYDRTGLPPNARCPECGQSPAPL